MFMYMRNHDLAFFKNIVLRDGVLNNSWFNTKLKNRNTYNILEGNDLTFEELSDDANYIHIPTFNGRWFAKISEFYEKYDSLIQSKPYLIIDVRNNGGGSDACVNPLLNYIYTKPFRDDDVDIYATRENIRKYKEWLDHMSKDTLNYSHEFIKSFSEEIDKMTSVPNKTFVSRGESEVVELDKVLPNPQRVIIITNRYCASSCETLLFWALESDKALIVGENSGGYVGYGEIGEIPTPNFNFWLGCTMSRYSNQRAYEVDGVPPHVRLNYNENWVKQSLELIQSDSFKSNK